ncbi:MAG: phosphatidylglycerophosphatase A [Kiloniellales bacterium]|jgi:phosphatidylglycerophosphatase A|nr:phosphatidylglycerophosphatase A [Kiloniellales bacterium]
MSERPAVPLFRADALVATWFGVGLIRGAPGTWGSLAALPCAAGLTLLGGPWLLLATTGLLTLAGVWASGRYAAALASGDPGVVVVDEVAGQWLALVPLPLDIWWYLAAFVLFRLFDVAKPWPIGWLDRKVSGGLGIMADDLAAGLAAGALAHAAWLWLG